MKKPIIELQHVWKTYRIGEQEVNALQGVNLKVFPGEFLAIQGPSGSGKSTTINMIGCLDIPTRGEVYLDRQNISKISESRLAQIRGKKIGFIFQKFNLIETLTALENVMLPMIFQGIPDDERHSRAEKLLTRFGLKDRMHHKPNQLSGGEQQRVAIARSLATNPLVVLADEPTGNLDSKAGRDVMLFLRELNEHEGKTIVLVTHDDMLARTADRIAFLKDGAITKSQIVRGGKK